MVEGRRRRAPLRASRIAGDPTERSRALTPMDRRGEREPPPSTVCPEKSNEPQRPRWRGATAGPLLLIAFGHVDQTQIADERGARACTYTTWGGPFFSGVTGDNSLGACAEGFDRGGLRRRPGAPGTRTALAPVDANQAADAIALPSGAEFPSALDRCGDPRRHTGAGVSRYPGQPLTTPSGRRRVTGRTRSADRAMTESMSL